MCYFSFSLPALIYLSMLFGSFVEERQQLRLIVDMENVAILPRMYRSCAIPKKGMPLCVQKSLLRLPISGSAQFSVKSLETLLKVIGVPAKDILIVDLREEAHGFINGEAVSWYFNSTNWSNIGLSTHAILSQEKLALKQISKEKWIKIFYSKKSWIPFLLPIDSAFSEKQLSDAFGLRYVRLPVTDHWRPTNLIVDQCVKLVKSLPPTTWLHFHCAGGKGRTSTFMVMYDCMFNASSLSLDNILYRQNQIGGTDQTLIPTKDWKVQYQQERLAFFKEFYLYCQVCPNHEISWLEWIDDQFR